MLTNDSSRLNNFQKLQSKNKTFQAIERPYIAQYKVFQQRLNNPRFKTKHQSFILRKTKNNKENVSQLHQIYESTKSFLLKTESVIKSSEQQQTLFKTQVDYLPIKQQLDQTSKQHEIVTKFKDRIWHLKYKNTESQIYSEQNSRIKTLGPLTLTQSSRKNLTQISNPSINTSKQFGNKTGFNKESKQNQKGKLSFMKYKKNKHILLQKLNPKQMMIIR